MGCVGSSSHRANLARKRSIATSVGCQTDLAYTFAQKRKKTECAEKKFKPDSFGKPRNKSMECEEQDAKEASDDCSSSILNSQRDQEASKSDKEKLGRERDTQEENALCLEVKQLGDEPGKENAFWRNSSVGADTLTSQECSSDEGTDMKSIVKKIFDEEMYISHQQSQLAKTPHQDTFSPNNKPKIAKNMTESSKISKIGYNSNSPYTPISFNQFSRRITKPNQKYFKILSHQAQLRTKNRLRTMSMSTNSSPYMKKFQVKSLTPKNDLIRDRRQRGQSSTIIYSNKMVKRMSKSGTYFTSYEVILEKKLPPKLKRVRKNLLENEGCHLATKNWFIDVPK
jgi:hypothetical protein